MKPSSTGSTPKENSEAHFTETARLEALRSFDILDTLPEKEYDDLTQLAAAICQAPISLISLVDENRQWFKSRTGIEAEETPLSDSFCRFALVNQDEVMVIRDTEKDARFCDHPMVTGEPHIRFYAGAPLVSVEGYAMGTLCVLDSAPREFDKKQQQMLQILARQVMTQLELRRMLARAASEAAELQTAHKQTQNLLVEVQDLYDNTPFGYHSLDENGIIQRINQTELNWLGYTREETVGKMRYAEMLVPAYRADFEPRFVAFKRGGREVSIELELQRKDGSTLLCYLRSSVVRDANGEILFTRSSVADISELKEKERQLAEYQKRLEEAVASLKIVAVTDSLTGLKNRGAMMERLNEEVQRARRYELPLSLAMVDVDYFKTYNDSFGHLAGDGVLHRVSEILQTHARPSDFSARYGGEEFVVILSNTALAGALAHAERIRHAIETEKWPQRNVTASIGVASLSEKIADGNALLRAADSALYKAKNAGRNRVAQ